MLSSARCLQQITRGLVSFKSSHYPFCSKWLRSAKFYSKPTQEHSSQQTHALLHTMALPEGSSGHQQCHSPVSLLVRHCSEASKTVQGYLGLSGYHNTNDQEARWAITKVRAQAHLETLQRSFSFGVSHSPLYCQGSYRKLSHILPGYISLKVFTLSSCNCYSSLFRYPVSPAFWLVWFGCWCYVFLLLGIILQLNLFLSVSSFDLVTSVELQEGIIHNHHTSTTSCQHLQQSSNKTFGSP